MEDPRGIIDSIKFRVLVYSGGTLRCLDAKFERNYSEWFL